MIRELLLAGAPMVLAWAAVLYKLPVLWRPLGRPGLRADWFAHLPLALALTFLLAPAYLALDEALGVPNLARLLGHASVLIAGWYVTVYFANLALPIDRAQAETKRGAAALALALLLLAVTFRLANIGEEDAFDFTGHFSNRPFVFEYRLVFLVYLAWTMIVLIRLANRHAWATATRLGLPYAVPKPEFAKEVLMAVSIGLLLVGATLPAWRPRFGVPRLYRWYRQYQACRRLYPLWRDLGRAVPEAALVPPRSPIADAVTLRDVELGLIRRVIEIRDCRLALREVVAGGGR